ncbi:phytanoyl-CoA dioxygenase family protein [Actinomadura barringtoniae]|uniref:Phytanoyl-CoA dioxygenase family protein n=1 Tax=Actinomadura barringtoniae TaxID=1427535 RepID=A0A939PJV4_9ACTN|nr:phytanoyl-CoA dioxygenase family protein [Actinomadura barringtoniae]MBO2453695.1 phytanoyl-CoA dioxygenase family protein [Actinomadura barringtoniae]
MGVSVLQAPVREVTEREIADFRANGWARLPGLVDPAFVADLRERALDRLEERRERERQGRRGTFRNGFVDKAFGQDRDIARHDEAFAALALSPRLAHNVTRLLVGVDSVRLQVTNLLIKEPAGSEGHGETAFHQDFPWMPMDRSSMLTVWLALADVPADMGALRFYNGSHRYGSLGRSFVREDDDALTQHPWLEMLELSEPFDLAAGDATVHSSLVIHGAPANRRDEPRLSFTATYFDATTLYTGAAYGQTDGLGLEVNKPFDHPMFPVVPAP